MAFNINEIKANMKNGGIRNTMFQVDLTFPSGIGQEAARKVPFRIKAASLPATQLGVIRIPYFGRTIKIAGDREYSAWSVTVMDDEDFLISQALETWAFQINSIVGNLANGAGVLPADYKRDALVTQYARNGNVLRVYKFTGLFPTVKGGVQVDWDARDQIELFEVNFEYDYFEVVGGTTGRVQN